MVIEPPKDMVIEGIDYEILYPIEYLVALPPRHPLIRKQKLKLADLLDENLIVGSPHTIGRKQLEQALFRLGLTWLDVRETKVHCYTDVHAGGPPLYGFQRLLLDEKREPLNFLQPGQTNYFGPKGSMIMIDFALDG